MDLYKKAQSYAYALDPKNYKDLVHDAYIVWFDKTGENLFAAPERTIINVIRNLFRRKSQKKYFMFNGTNYRKNTKEYDEEVIPEKDYSRITLKNNNPTPEDLYIAEESRECLLKKLTASQREVFGFVETGYSMTDVSNELNISAALASYYIQQIRKKLN